MNGRLLKTQHGGSASGVIDLSDQPNGVYLLRTKAGDNLLNIRLIKYE
jgi:hypothetical protein